MNNMRVLVAVAIIWMDLKVTTLSSFSWVAAPNAGASPFVLPIGDEECPPLALKTSI